MFFLCRNLNYCKNLSNPTRGWRKQQRHLLPFAGWGRQCSSLVPTGQSAPAVTPQPSSLRVLRIRSKKTQRRKFRWISLLLASQSSGAGLLHSSCSNLLHSSKGAPAFRRPCKLQGCALLLSSPPHATPVQGIKDNRSHKSNTEKTPRASRCGSREERVPGQSRAAPHGGYVGDCKHQRESRSKVIRVKNKPTTSRTQGCCFLV